MSVLTDPGFFGGQHEDLVEARAASTLPVLRKDFIFDPYQVYEARAIGADCVLLIVACLDDRRLRELAQLALALGMAVLPEVHDRQELDRALRLDTPLVGINNRDLRSLDVSLSTTLDLASAVPAGKTLVTESGIATARDVAVMREAGVHAFLVGEALMGFDDPAEGLASIFGSGASPRG
jgi:indole-3-glycerol phosphate synthase